MVTTADTAEPYRGYRFRTPDGAAYEATDLAAITAAHPEAEITHTITTDALGRVTVAPFDAKAEAKRAKADAKAAESPPEEHA